MPARGGANQHGLAAAFGVEVESAARTASEGVAQLVTGPEGNSALGLVQERG
jgi:hypothetical protein